MRGFNEASALIPNLRSRQLLKNCFMEKSHSAWFKYKLFLHRNWKASFPTWTTGDRKQTKEMGWRKRKKNRLCLSQQTDDSCHITRNFFKICYSCTCLIAARNMSQIVAAAFLYDQNVTNYSIQKNLCKEYLK